jgi:hypothetical protein
VRRATYIAAHPPAQLLGAGAQLLSLDAALLRGERRARRHALLRHAVQSLQALGEAPEGGLAVAELRGRILRDDHDARGRVHQAQRRFRAVHVLAAGAARAEHLHLDLALEDVAIEGIRRRALRFAGGHGGARVTAVFCRLGGL